MKQSLILIFLITLVTSAKAQNQVNMTINLEAPVIQTKEIFINAAPEKVWEVLTDIKNWGEWNNRIKKPTLQEELKVGTAFTWKTNGSKIKSKIHTYRTNQVMGWTGKTFGARAIHNWYLEPINNGTLVKVEESMEGWVIRLMKNKMDNILKEDMDFWLQQLKIKSEK